MLIMIILQLLQKKKEKFLKLKEEKKRYIICKFCSNNITDSSKIISIENCHNHTFVNPAGIIYNINCYSEAKGCIVTGEKTEEFSWFKGFKWQFASCNSCFNHLGWFYTSDNYSFFGLISNYLLEK